jgi:myo-inositol-1(or 4)-monophosphatase
MGGEKDPIPCERIGNGEAPLASTTMNDLELAIHVARTAGAIVRDSFDRGVAPEYKARFDPVTEIDRRADDAIVQVLRSERPNDGILSEEGGGETSARRHWIIDPLDGTVNFVHGIPQVSVSIALYDGDTGLVGVIFDPLRDEMFTASAGGGAQLNDRTITVSTEPELEGSVVATGFPYDHGLYAAGYAATVGAVLEHVNGIRRFGSAALDLAWVAAGRYEGYWELGIAPWDQAAGIIVVREAGGRVTEPAGLDSTPRSAMVVATNGLIHDQLLSIVGAAMPVHLR